MFKNGDFVWDRHTLSTPTPPKLFDLFRCFPPSGCVHDSLIDCIEAERRTRLLTYYQHHDRRRRSRWAACVHH